MGKLFSESDFALSLEIHLQEFIYEGNSYFLGTIISLIMSESNRHISEEMLVFILLCLQVHRVRI